MDPKMCASFNFANVLKITKFAKLKRFIANSDYAVTNT